ncbi:MAG: hypothetical protein Q9N32_04420 [Gammaproteobacteria bacterium]|nr:hypothetical protein [Gammaproteobacteria bacterium]
MARLLPLLNSPLLFEWAVIFDIAFFVGLTLAILHPIIKVKQWRHDRHRLENNPVIIC